MRIGFNGQRLAGQRLGVGRYIEYLLRHWAVQLAPDDRLSLFLRRPPDAGVAALQPALQIVLRESRLSGIAWENLYLPAASRRQDVLFCPAYTSPLAYRRPVVVATHSVDEASEGTHSWRYRQTYARLYAWTARRAARVIVPSEFIRRAVVERYAVREERVEVIPQGADDSFVRVTDPAILTAVQRRFFGRARPYVLFVGKCSPRRNVPLLIRAFAHAKSVYGFPHGLLLFGPNLHGLPLQPLCRELGVEEDVVQVDGIIADHQEMVPIYSAADVFVHPSTIEGWSMTTAEAMACGTAVIAANRGGLGELARGHALMLDELSVTGLSEALGAVLGDADLRRDLQQRAIARAASLRWHDIAARTLQVVKDAAGRAP